jgi:hypothetical protein
MPKREEDEPQMIFHVVTPDGVQEVEIFLDERMLDQLNRYDESVWRGLISYVEGEVGHDSM